MMTADRTHMRPAQDLKAIVGCRRVKGKHLRAWNVITQYLNKPQHFDKVRTAPAPSGGDLAKPDRCIDNQVLQGLKAIWPANPTARPANILHLLLNVRERAEPRVLQARDEMTAHIERMMSRNKRVTGADLRRDAPKVYKRKRTPPTGYQQYCDLQEKIQTLGAKAKTKQIYDALLELYTRYSHTPDTIIAVTALYKKDAPSRERQAPTAGRPSTPACACNLGTFSTTWVACPRGTTT